MSTRSVPLTNHEAESVNDIFELLKRKGPLCPSQISVELLVPLREVTAALRLLHERRAIEPRHDNRLTQDFDDDCSPWGLRTRTRRSGSVSAHQRR
jgi:hypothetical protein